MSIWIRDVNKAFGEKQVLQHVTVELADDKIYCLMGPSGMGKTTLLRIILGAEQADSGAIEGVTEGEIGMMYQEDRLLDFLTPVENVALVCPKKPNLRQIRQDLKDILPEECLRQPVAQLSGGMKRRVALARAMYYPSKLIVLDEPFTGLDRATKQVVVNYVLKMRKGRIMLVATHGEEDVTLLGGTKLRLEDINHIGAQGSAVGKAARPRILYPGEENWSSACRDIQRRCVMFRDVQFADFEGLMKEMGAYIRWFQKDELLCGGGSRLDAVGVVLSGEVEAGMEAGIDAEGRQIIHRAGAGDLFAEAIAFGNQTSWVDLEALSDAEVLFIPADAMRNSQRAEVHQMLVNLLSAMAFKMQTLSFKARLLKEIKIRERLFIYLNSLPKDKDGYVEIPFSQVDLAEYLGVSRSALSHEIKLMRDAGLLEGDRRRIRLCGKQ